MALIDVIKSKAKNNLKSLVLPEAKDQRILKAAEIIVSEGFASSVTLLGDEKSIYENAQKYHVSLNGIKIIDPQKSSKIDVFSQIYYEARKAKEPEITIKAATEMVKDPLFFGTSMIKTGQADALVAGAVNTTSKVLRATLRLLERTSKTGIVSSCFIMIVPNCEYGEKGIMAFADSAVVPDPKPQQLADIAISTANTFKVLIGSTPKVAMLSFSTKGSTKHRLVDKVIEATNIVRKSNPELLIDGELQVDAALVPFVAKQKAPSSNIAGKANVLIFPDLGAANIAYKLVERLAKAKAYGPLLQGLNKPISDLSRGCSINDIVDISAITLLRAAEKAKDKSFIK